MSRAASGRARRWAGAAGALAAAAVVAAAVTPVSASATALAAGRGLARPGRRHHGPGKGSTLTVLEPYLSWTSGLDPLTNPQATSDQTIEDAVFGELFELGPGGRTIDDLASGAQIEDGGRTLVIEVRKGVTFSDGAPFDAAAVAHSLRSDLTAVERPSLPISSVTTSGPDRVIVHLSRPDGAVLDQFQDSVANWVVDSRALHKMGATAYAQSPVGAGPFTVAANTTNDKLVLRRNPRYWQKGHPFLGGLVFQAQNGGDQAALEDLRSGIGQAVEAVSTPALVGGFTGAGFRATLEPSTSTLFVALDRRVRPFDRLEARRALYLATDAASLDRVLNGDAVPTTESFTGPTGLFYEPKVPGYPAYDLSAAKALVRRLGGLRFTLVVSPFLAQGLGAALQSMYDEAGMKVTLATPSPRDGSLPKRWGALVSSLGSFDPAGPSGLAAYAKAPVVGPLLARGAATVGLAARAPIYAKAARAFAGEALGPFLYPPAVWSIAAKGVTGPGLTTELPSVGLSPAIRWQDVSMRR